MNPKIILPTLSDESGPELDIPSEWLPAEDPQETSLLWEDEDLFELAE